MWSALLYIGQTIVKGINLMRLCFGILLNNTANEIVALAAMSQVLVSSSYMKYQISFILKIFFLYLTCQTVK